MTVLETIKLSKKFGRLTALDQLNVRVEQGQVLGVLGPNGSGKTTFLSMVLNAIFPSTGEFKWFGEDFSHLHLKRVGALLESPHFFPKLNAIQNLDIIAHIREVKNPDYEELLSAVDLYDRRNDAFQTYSLGMKQRLAIASVMLGKPEVMIFDEPTNGLDPKGIVDVRNILVQLAASGKTIIMASHILAEVEKICSHLAILNKGHLLAYGPLGDILSTQPTLELASSDLPQLVQWVSNLSAYQSHSIINGKVHVVFEDNVVKEDLYKQAYEGGIDIQHFQWIHTSLEDEYIQIIENAEKI